MVSWDGGPGQGRKSPHLWPRSVQPHHGSADPRPQDGQPLSARGALGAGLGATTSTSTSSIPRLRPNTPRAEVTGALVSHRRPRLVAAVSLDYALARGDDGSLRPRRRRRVRAQTTSRTLLRCPGQGHAQTERNFDVLFADPSRGLGLKATHVRLRMVERLAELAPQSSPGRVRGLARGSGSGMPADGVVAESSLLAVDDAS